MAKKTKKPAEPDVPPAPGRFDEWVWSGNLGSDTSMVKFPARTPRVAELMEKLLVASMQYAEYCDTALKAFGETKMYTLPVDPDAENQLLIHLNNMRYAACTLYAFRDDK